MNIADWLINSEKRRHGLQAPKFDAWLRFLSEDFRDQRPQPRSLLAKLKLLHARALMHARRETEAVALAEAPRQFLIAMQAKRAEVAKAIARTSPRAATVTPVELPVDPDLDDILTEQDQDVRRLLYVIAAQNATHAQAGTAPSKPAMTTKSKPRPKADDVVDLLSEMDAEIAKGAQINEVLADLSKPVVRPRRAPVAKPVSTHDDIAAMLSDIDRELSKHEDSAAPKPVKKRVVDADMGEQDINTLFHSLEKLTHHDVVPREKPKQIKRVLRRERPPLWLPKTQAELMSAIETMLHGGELDRAAHILRFRLPLVMQRNPGMDRRCQWYAATGETGLATALACLSLPVDRPYTPAEGRLARMARDWLTENHQLEEMIQDFPELAPHAAAIYHGFAALQAPYADLHGPDPQAQRLKAICATEPMTVISGYGHATLLLRDQPMISADEGVVSEDISFLAKTALAAMARAVREVLSLAAESVQVQGLAAQIIRGFASKLELELGRSDVLLAAVVAGVKPVIIDCGDSLLADESQGSGALRVAWGQSLLAQGHPCHLVGWAAVGAKTPALPQARATRLSRSARRIAQSSYAWFGRHLGKRLPDSERQLLGHPLIDLAHYPDFRPIDPQTDWCRVVLHRGWGHFVDEVKLAEASWFYPLHALLAPMILVELPRLLHTAIRLTHARGLPQATVDAPDVVRAMLAVLAQPAADTLGPKRGDSQLGDASNPRTWRFDAQSARVQMGIGPDENLVLCVPGLDDTDMAALRAARALTPKPGLRRIVRMLPGDPRGTLRSARHNKYQLSIGLHVERGLPLVNCMMAASLVITSAPTTALAAALMGGKVRFVGPVRPHDRARLAAVGGVDLTEAQDISAPPAA